MSEGIRFADGALAVAPILLGALLSSATDEGTVTVRLTEVEAYLGTGEDSGSHAHRGPTPRTRPMFGPPGHLYVYRSYGIHACVNLVCSPEGEASAVLLRAGEVVAGRELARARRVAARVDRDLARGPGRLTEALGIRLDDDGVALGDRIALQRPAEPVPFRTGPRIGVAAPAGGAEFPWRFWIDGDPTVSPYRAHASLRPAPER